MSQRKNQRAPTRRRCRPFGRPYVEAVYGIAPRSEPRKAVHAKKPNLWTRRRRWFPAAPPSKSAEQKAAAAAARALGADPSERVVDDPAAQATGLRNLGATCGMTRWCKPSS